MSVVLSVSLESPMGYRMRVDELFCGVSLSGTMQSASFCTHRFVVDCGKPSGVAIFLLPMSRLPVCQWRKVSSSAEGTILHAKCM